MAHRKLKVLSSLRELHRTKRVVFEGDAHAQEVTRQKIREEFRKNAAETTPSKIDELITLATDVAKVLRASVVQVKQKEPGSETYELKLTKDTILSKNTMFDPDADIPDEPRKKKCSDPAPTQAPS